MFEFAIDVGTNWLGGHGRLGTVVIAVRVSIHACVYVCMHACMHACMGMNE